VAGSLPGMHFDRGLYYARVVVPKDVRPVVGKWELIESLKTGSFADAKKAAPPVLARFKRVIADARTGAASRTDTSRARAALSRWGVDEGNRPPDLSDLSLAAPWQSLVLAADCQKAVKDPDGWQDIPDFDSIVAGMLRAGGLSVGSDDPVIPLMRREAALHLLYAAKFHEQQRRLAALEAASRVDLDDLLVVSPAPAKALPAPSLPVSELFEEWLEAVSPSEKEGGRLRHQMRRFVEVIGNKPANFVTKDDVATLMKLVVRFPGRMRSTALNALPMPKLVEAFEAENAKLTAADQPPMPTLSEKSVGHWLAGWKRMFELAVNRDWVEKNPLRGMEYTIKGAPSVSRREFSDDEIQIIFGAPLFQGFGGDGRQGYRKEPGKTVSRDAKFWLPILALFHGGRLTEFAAAPLADVKQTVEGTWFFDLTAREIGGLGGVKNKTSRRQIPMHPHMLAIGFVDYVLGLRGAGEAWLFPDLDHASRFGPGHEFSKWFGRWMDVHGLPDPTITHHSWRHTWKRRARESDVPEERHDVITGHAPATISRGYGKGVSIEVLAKDIASITFPSFPELPSQT